MTEERDEWRKHIHGVANAWIDQRLDWKQLKTVTMSHVHIFHRFWGIARYWSKIADLNLPHLNLVSSLGITL